MTGPYERRAFPLTLRSDGGTPRKIVGHAAVFNSDSEEMGWFTPYRERILPGAFDAALQRVRSGQDTVYALLNHDENYIISSTADHTLDLSVDAVGLVAEMQPMDTQTIRDLVVTPIQQGKINKMSFGFTVSDDHEEKLAGVKYRIIDQVGQLFDVSPVVFPAYAATDVQARRIYRALGLNPAALSLRQVTSLRAFVDAFGIGSHAEPNATKNATAKAFGIGQPDTSQPQTRQMLVNGPSPEMIASLSNIDLLADTLDEAIDTLLDELGIPDADEAGEPEETPASGAYVPRRRPIARKVSAAKRKAAFAAVAPVVLAGAGIVRLRELDLRDRDLNFYSGRNGT